MKTITSKTESTSDPAGWPTQFTDQHIAIEIIKRHSEEFGYVKLLEHVGQVSNKGGGTFEVEFSPWLHELMQRFDALYKPDVSQAAFEHTVKWLVREIFKGQASVSIQ